MTIADESRLDLAVGRAARAERLLADELLVEAFAALEDAYTAAWRSTTIDDASGREKLFLAINVVGRHGSLTAAVTNGKLAKVG